ncbi:hypothetical protein L6452_00718 [Arctium lappa]|uniref:Uncharacterized protein n=1 Tax=Arctium lappa TaxID=4217 RepID=A0ACB9FET5_ARCLA|nr:hypothetical protein L6452_00718 [Arctium lappa]
MDHRKQQYGGGGGGGGSSSSSFTENLFGPNDATTTSSFVLSSSVFVGLQIRWHSSVDFAMLFFSIGMASRIILQVLYDLLESWTAYLINVLYVECPTKEKENSFKNHVIQDAFSLHVVPIPAPWLGLSAQVVIPRTLCTFFTTWLAFPARDPCFPHIVLFPRIVVWFICTSQVVGWPPVKTYRMNNLVNQAKFSKNEEEKGVGGTDGSKKKKWSSNKNDEKMVKETGHSGFVKVNMDGLPIGRKVDLNTYGCYETLGQAIEIMFLKASSIRIWD